MLNEAYLTTYLLIRPLPSHPQSCLAYANESMLNRADEVRTESYPLDLVLESYCSSLKGQFLHLGREVAETCSIEGSTKDKFVLGWRKGAGQEVNGKSGSEDKRFF